MKTFPKIINLYNRYRDKTYLEQIEGNKYKINCGEFVRIGYPEGTTYEEMKTTHVYEFIDPPGGPFMRVGCTLDTYNEKDEFIIEKLYSEKLAEKEYQLIAEIKFKENN